MAERSASRIRGVGLGTAQPPGRRDGWQKGWLVNLGNRGLGDVLLGLAKVQALADAAGGRYTELLYQGPHAALMRRNALPLATVDAPGRHVVRNPHRMSAAWFEFARSFHLPPAGAWPDPSVGTNHVRAAGRQRTTTGVGKSSTSSSST
jgi:hypothetical protein